jgi:zinc protease
MTPSRQRRLAGAVLALAAGLGVASLSPSIGRTQQSAAATEPAAGTFRLDNGMEVVVLPDRRLPVVTHMIFYKVGAADEPTGRSGLAHLLEHLMFKATTRIGPNEYSRIISRIGARDNAVTSADMTYYYQRVPRTALGQVMQLEADRIRGLKLVDAEIEVERQVVLGERRTSIEAEPLALLSEQMLTVLYANHPYRTPAIGWPHELVTLTRADAEPFYRRHYAPNNAIVVIAGDVSLEEMKALARDVYGSIPASADLPERRRPSEPPAIAPRRVIYENPRATSPLLVRMYTTPSYRTAERREAESLELLAHLLGHGDTSRMSEKLVLDLKVAVAAAATYSGEARDGGRLTLFAVPAPGVELATLEKHIDAVIADLAANGASAADLASARTNIDIQQAFNDDSQFQRARRIGEALAHGRSLSDLDASRHRMMAVDTEDLKSVARRYVDLRRSVTGLLLPTSKAAARAGSP